MLFYTKYRFNEHGVRIGCNYSCCNLERRSASRTEVVHSVFTVDTENRKR